MWFKMREIFRGLANVLQEAFRPLPTFEEASANFPHVPNCPNSGGLNMVIKLETAPGGLNAMAAGAHNQWFLECSFCHSSVRFREESRCCVKN